MNFRIIHLLASVLFSVSMSAHNTIPLDGQWHFSSDSTSFDAAIYLPGSMASNNLGNEVNLSTPWVGGIADSSFFKAPEYAEFRTPGNFKVSFWLQPVKYYRGPAWYSRSVSVPADWSGKRISLILERCHWETTLWVDSVLVGSCDALGAPHSYDLSKVLSPGKHSLTIKVDNSVSKIDPGINSHSVSDHTQSNWNGIVGRIALVASEPVSISHTTIFPSISHNSVTVSTEIQNITPSPAPVTLSSSVGKHYADSSFLVPTGTSVVTQTIDLGAHPSLWNEFNPHLYTLVQKLTDTHTGAAHSSSHKFGMREIKASDGRILINNRPVFLRGTLDCAAFPITGYPPTDVPSWARIINKCKSYGLNHIRFHSWCPPEAAFIAADSLGMYLQIECSSWANQSVSIGDGLPVDSFVVRESNAIVRAYGNHPSFCMMIYGNEPAGNNMNMFLTNFVADWQHRDNRRIYCAGAGWPNLRQSDYLSDASPRIQLWGAGNSSIINSQAPSTDFDFNHYLSGFSQPMVSHEIGQWCAYPNFREITKYTGVLKPRNFEIFRTTLARNGMAHLADSFLIASGKLQTLCYKADIEAALRTGLMDGFQLLGLSDFPGQGTALVGVLDAFYEEKGYVSAPEFSRFCASTVPLARIPRLILSEADTLNATLQVAHYGDSALVNCPVNWTLKDASAKVIASHSSIASLIPSGYVSPVGHISLPLASITAPQKLSLELKVGNHANDWSVWVYPSASCPPSTLMVKELDDNAIHTLQQGGNVLLSIPKGKLSAPMGGDIQIGFSSIFWNTAWTRGQAPHTLGLLCNPSHPALSLFPTDFHSDYQWWDAMTHSSPIIISELDPSLLPIVRVIDDWFTNRPLALLLEAKVLNGKLLISGIDFWTDMHSRPEARQLLHSIDSYISSPSFNPSITLTTQQISALTTK